MSVVESTQRQTPHRGGGRIAAQNAVYFLKIDLDRLRQNLSAAQGTPLSHEDVCSWLARNGYQFTGVGWVLVGESIRALASSEIISAWRLL